MTKKQIINTSKAPKAIGPYSQAVKIDNLLFISGQIPIIPETGELAEGDIKVQAEQVLNNLKAILESCGSDLKNVVKTTVFIADMKDFANVNEVYSKFFTGEFPARSCVEVSKLPKDVSVEIEAIAYVDKL